MDERNEAIRGALGLHEFKPNIIHEGPGWPKFESDEVAAGKLVELGDKGICFCVILENYFPGKKSLGEAQYLYSQYYKIKKARNQEPLPWTPPLPAKDNEFELELQGPNDDEEEEDFDTPERRPLTFSDLESLTPQKVVFPRSKGDNLPWTPQMKLLMLNAREHRMQWRTIESRFFPGVRKGVPKMVFNIMIKKLRTELDLLGETELSQQLEPKSKKVLDYTWHSHEFDLARELLFNGMLEMIKKKHAAQEKEAKIEGDEGKKKSPKIKGDGGKKKAPKIKGDETKKEGGGESALVLRGAKVSFPIHDA